MNENPVDWYVILIFMGHIKAFDWKNNILCCLFLFPHNVVSVKLWIIKLIVTVNNQPLSVITGKQQNPPLT